MATKVCISCKKEKRADQFNKAASCTDGRRTECRACQAIYNRDHKIRSRYGLSRAEYLALVAKQCGRCAICEQPQKTWHVDHDHVTGAVRGLLCRYCNVGLGFYRDDPATLAAAIRYLKRAS